MINSLFNITRTLLIVATVMFAALATMDVTAQTARAGWASVTGFRGAETGVQRAIRDAALRGDHQSSGPSNTNGTWLTDAADGDGARMRSAINHYQAWYWLNPTRRISFDQVKVQMAGDFGGSAYDQTRRLLLVAQIVERYNQAVRFGPVRLPITDNDTLAFLEIRKQCLEWAMTTAISGGGRSKNYSATAVTDPRAFRPGMGLYRVDRSHAMIVVDIRWDASGNPVEFKVAESNWGSGWQNPPGMLPWLRTVGTRTGITFNSALYKVVNYEAP